MQHRTSAIAWIVPLIVTAGCNAHVYSPPARAMPLESAETLEPGATGLQGQASAHGELFGPNVNAFSVKARHGLAENVEGSVAPILMYVHGDGGESSASPWIYGSRIGGRLQLAEWLTLSGGLGGGVSDAGGFLSPDVGGTVAWENTYLVPFVTLSGWTSIPIAPKQIEIVVHEEEGDETHVGRPHLTWGATVSPGLRLALPLGESLGRPRGSLYVAVSLTRVADQDDGATYSGAGAGAELVF